MLLENKNIFTIYLQLIHKNIYKYIIDRLVNIYQY